MGRGGQGGRRERESTIMEPTLQPNKQPAAQLRRMRTIAAAVLSFGFCTILYLLASAGNATVVNVAMKGSRVGIGGVSPPRNSLSPAPAVPTVTHLPGVGKPEPDASRNVTQVKPSASPLEGFTAAVDAAATAVQESSITPRVRYRMLDRNFSTL